MFFEMTNLLSNLLEVVVPTWVPSMRVVEPAGVQSMGVVVATKFPSMGQIEIFNHLEKLKSF